MSQIAAPRDREAVRSAKRNGIEMRQNYRRLAKRAGIIDWRIGTRVIERARRQLKFQHTRLGWIAPFVQNHSEIARP